MEKIYANLDSDESAFFSRDLEHIRSRAYEVQYPELKARSLIPGSPDPAPDGAKTVIYEMEDGYGAAKLIAMGSDGSDLPSVNVTSEQFLQKIRECGVSFDYTLDEIRQAARTGKSLTDKKARRARRASEELLDDILALGDTTADLKGFLKHASVNATSVANPGGGTAWTTKTADQILTDMNEPGRLITDNTKGIYGSGLTMLLPLAQYDLIATKPMPNLNTTVLEFFLRTSKTVREVVPWYKVKGIGSGSADRMVVYKRDPDVLNSEIPAEFEILDPQPRGFKFIVPCRLTTGGVIMHQPKACEYRDGI